LIFRAILPDIFEIWVDYAIREIANLFGFFFALIFLANTFVPIYDTYRKTNLNIREIELSTPARLKDVVVADILWKLPFYAWMVLIIGPIFISLLELINQMNILNYLFVYIALFGIFAFSLLIGTLIVNLLERNILPEKTKSRSYYVFIISFIFIGLVYCFQFLIDFLIAFPQWQFTLIFFPSFWYSNIILFNVQPNLIVFAEFNYLISMILACSIPMLFFYFYYKKIEIIFHVESTKDNSENDYNLKFIEKFITFLTPTRWHHFILTQIREFFRDKENRVKITFTIFTLVLTGIVMLLSFNQLRNFLIEELSFIYTFEEYKLLAIFLISWIGSLLFGLLSLVYPFFKSKEIIFFHRKIPHGMNYVLFSYIFSQFQIVLLLDIIITASFAIIFLLNFLQIILIFSLFLVFTLITSIICVGIQCLHPLYKHKSKIVFINIYYFMAIEIISLFIVFNILIPFIPRDTFHLEGLIQIILFHLLIKSLFFPLILILGIRKLKRLE
jgi:hypothetical protein